MVRTVVVDRAVDIEAVDEDAEVILREDAKDEAFDTKGLWLLMPSRSFICWRKKSTLQQRCTDQRLATAQQLFLMS